MYQKWLQAFHAVAIHGNFTIAGKALNVGQSTVSIHVINLEKRFDVELFHRRSGSVQLTPTGKTLLTITNGLYGYETEALELLKGTKKFDTGELKLSAINSFDVMEILQAFRDNHSRITLNVALGKEYEVLENLDNFSADVGIVGRDISNKRYFSQFYKRHSILAIFNVTHPLAKRKALKLRDLDDQEMILRPPVSTTRKAFEAAIAGTGINIIPLMEMNNLDAVREAIIRGFGFGVMSETDFSPHENLRALRISDVDIHTKTYIICLVERRERLLIRIFFRTAEDLVQSH